MYPLFTGFLGSMTLPAIMRKAFFGQLPTAVEDIDVLNDKFALMALGLPRWLPIPSSKKVCLARDHLHQNLEQLYNPLDLLAKGRNPCNLWRDLHGVSHLIKGHNSL